MSQDLIYFDIQRSYYVMRYQFAVLVVSLRACYSVDAAERMTRKMLNPRESDNDSENEHKIV